MFSLVLIFIMLLGCSAFFSASETALFSLSRVRLHGFGESGKRASALIFKLLEQPRQTLVTILFGNELSNVSISVVGAAIISRIVPLDFKLQTVIAVGALTPIIMVFCEILPKNIALRFADQLAPIFVYPIHLFSRLISPFRLALTWFAGRMVMLFGGSPEKDAPMIMEEEYRRLVDLGSREGVIEEEEREIIHNVFEFTDKRVGDIMTPAEQIFALPEDLPSERLHEEIRNTMYSRMPIYEGEPRSYIGILHMRDYFSYRVKLSRGEHPNLREFLRRPLFVSKETPLEELLKEFQRTHLHMALVVEGEEKVIGVITMDNVQEELFGELEE